MLNAHHRLLSLTLALAATAAFSGCTVESDNNDDVSPTLGGRGGTGGSTSGGTGGGVSGGTSGSGATGGLAAGAGGGETGGTSGGTAGAAGEGGGGPACLQLADLDLDGDGDPETGKPDCADLPYGEQSCAGADPSGLYLCRTAAVTYEPGVFQALYSALEGIQVDDACSAEHDAAVAAVLAGDENQPGIRASACDNAEAGSTCEALGATAALTGCEQSLNMLNETGQTQVLKCMADSSLDGDPDYGAWQDRFEKLCRTPAVPESYSDTQGATRSCDEVSDLFLDERCENRSIAICQQFDGSWARGGFFDALVEELSYNPHPDACSAEHAAYADAVLADLRRAAAPSLTGGEVCASIAGGCPALSADECRLHIDFLTSTTQQEDVLVCMTLAPDESTCRQTFLTDCVID